MNIILLLAVLYITISLLMGLAFLLTGLYKKNRSFIKSGILLMSIPVTLVLVGLILYNTRSTKQVTAKATIRDMVGTYHIGEFSSRIPVNQYKSYKLEIRNDSSFSLSPTPHIDLCENGKYKISINYNELWFTCDNHTTSAEIVNNDNKIQIEFILGDPDEGESIYFEKD